MNVAGEVAVITGGASGIGRGTALALARRGADIVLADVNDRRLAAVEAEIAGMGRRVVAVHCDVSRDDDVQQLAERAESNLGPGGVRTNLAETGRSIGMTPERQVAETRMAQSVQGGPELEAEYVGELVAQAVRNETFLILPDDVHAELLRRRGRDLNAFVKSRLAAQ